jgi:cytochrome c
MQIPRSINKSCCVGIIVKGDSMRFLRWFLPALLLVAVFAFSVGAVEKRASEEECIAFVKRAVAYLKEQGPEKAFADFSDPKNGAFHDRDLYILVLDSDGVCLAHGLYNRIIGTNRLDVQDATGRFYAKEKIEEMKTKDQFWENYRYPDPLSKKIMEKKTYCETVDNVTPKKVVVCAGIYRDGD